MRLRRAIILTAIVAVTAGCAGPISDPNGQRLVADTTTADDSVQPDAPPSDAAQLDAPVPQAESPFVPMADDLIVWLDYGDEMDGPGWYRVTILDPAFPASPMCETTIETDSSEGLSANDYDEYVCGADLFNALSASRPTTDTYTINITNSHGNELSDPLTYNNGSFTNEVNNVITYGVP